MYFATGGAKAIAVKLHVYVNGRATIWGFTRPAASERLFPEELVSPVNDGRAFNATYGVGTNGAVSVVQQPHGMEFLRFTLQIDANAVVGDKMQIAFGPGSSVAVEGYNQNAIQGMIGTAFEVVAPTEKPGDANGDGKVDIFDYSLVVTNFGKRGANIPGDVDHDGDVDIFDYSLVVTNFGK
jgi:hypothetical protein